jgi:formylglycine-generating enzyme required for sulfatase activity
VNGAALFYRGYDGYDHKSKSSPASISTFRLDRFEVTVGRFRRFVTAWNAGWRPAEGDGKHSHLNGGKGLTDSSSAASYEPGWIGAWESSVAPTETNLGCGGSKTWTTAAGSNERLPIVCQNWYEAYAFCIWDGGFLPSEAEWNYAAAGGTEQRRFPWGTAQDPTTIDCSYANYLGNGGARCVAAGPSAVGSLSPKGDGKYGQADLGGNAWEPSLDWYAEYVPTCNDCAYLTVSPYRMQRGGYFDFSEQYIDTARRDDSPPTGRYDVMGVRCARAP